MNRREFLATLGAGALSLAGKGIRRPAFVVEIEVMTNAIWINGKQPTKAWTHDDGVYNLDFSATGLVIDGVTFESLALSNNRCTDGDNYQVVGSKVTMKNSRGTFHGKITKVEDMSWSVKGDTEPTKVTLYNGKTLVLDKMHRYFRIEFPE